MEFFVGNLIVAGLSDWGCVLIPTGLPAELIPHMLVCRSRRRELLYQLFPGLSTAFFEFFRSTENAGQSGRNGPHPQGRGAGTAPDGGLPDLRRDGAQRDEVRREDVLCVFQLPQILIQLCLGGHHLAAVGDRAAAQRLPDAAFSKIDLRLFQFRPRGFQSTTGISSPNSSGRNRGQTFSVMQITDAARRLPISQASASVLP